MPSPDTTYVIAELPVRTVVPDIHPFAITVGDRAVLRRGGNGSAYYLSYRTAAAAARSLPAVQAQLPGAVLWER